MQLGISRHPRALLVRSTIQLTSIVTKGMTKSSEIDVVINNGDDDDEVWHTDLPSYLSDNIERIQIRAMKCIYPGHNYDYILTNMTKLPALQQRRDVICRKYFNKVTTGNSQYKYISNP